MCCTLVVVASANNSRPFVENEILVKFTEKADKKARTRVHSVSGADVVELIANSEWQRIKLPKGMSIESAVRLYEKDPTVEAVQPNFYYRLLATPNDPQYSSSGLYGLQSISAPAAWDLSTGSSDVVVAVIDTGIRLTHEDLAANLWTNPGEIPNNGIDDDGNGFVDDVYGWDFRYNDSDPSDQHGHGTHVAGTIGAVGNNSVGVVGVNWNVKMMAIKIYSPSGTDTTSAMLINAYNYVRIMKERGVNIRITNNSYGGCGEACGYDQATREAIDALGEAGILNVFAAGNNNGNTDSIPFYPGSYDLPSILNVANSNSSDQRNATSNYGVVSVDLAAPGTGILSTTNGSNSSYGGSSGTSMSAPHVAGAAALLAAYRPDLSVASLKATLMNTVDVLPAWNGLVKTGGRLNVAAALSSPTICTATVETESLFVRTKGGVFSVDASMPQNCDYSVRGEYFWIQPLTRSASGAQTVQFRVSVNNTIFRSGNLRVGDKLIQITQSRTGK
ncbi:MAG: S8 family serine peptidase [Acidobacteria bacterium]|nr:S8 family serine peptidase [Acidobacteriota bacterium]